MKLLRAITLNNKIKNDKQKKLSRLYKAAFLITQNQTRHNRYDMETIRVILV